MNIQIQDVPVRDHPDLVRDPSGAIKSTDKAAYIQFIESRARKIEEQKRINSLENEISELKAMVTSLINAQKVF